MARARYIIRLDDACPTMARRQWGAFEAIIDRFRLRPIVAVVPENRDPKLQPDRYDEKFWERVRSWQAKGWHVALHGHDHVYTSPSGGLIPINDQSEFAGVSLSEQRRKVRSGMEVFAEHGVDPQIWVAPSHSFDSNTLVALSEETPIRIISDGIALWPYGDGQFFWIPQQRWKLRAAALGVWTACYHPNTATSNDLCDFEKFLEFYHREIVDDVKALQVEFIHRRRHFLDDWMARAFFLRLRAKRRLKGLIRGRAASDRE